MSIEKNFCVVPQAVVTDIFNPWAFKYDKALIRFEYEKESSGIKVIFSNEEIMDKTIMARLALCKIDRKMAEGIDNKEFSEEEIKKLSLFEFMFSQENCYFMIPWCPVHYRPALNRICYAYGIMTLLVKSGAVDLNDKNWIKMLFKVLDELDVFILIKKVLEDLYEACGTSKGKCDKRITALIDAIENAGI